MTATQTNGAASAKPGVPMTRPPLVVITAATSWEAGPLIRRWGLEARGASLFEGRVGERNVLLVRTGIGRTKTAESLARIETGSDFIAVSSGLAGALQPGIRSGDLVADLRGAPLDALEAARGAAGGSGLTLHMGSFYTADAVVAAPEAKLALGRRLRAVAVDMESAAVREWCRSKGGTFIGLRAVLDAADQRLPDWPCEDESPRAAALYALSHWTRLPSLAGLGWRTRRSMARLGLFLDEWLRRWGP